jgi:Uma2 family endonuclease
MTTTSTAYSGTEAANGDQCVELRDVGWRGYLRLLKLRGQRSVPRLIYLDGSVQLVSPSDPHEWLAFRLGEFVTGVAAGLRISFRATRQLTFRKRSSRGGVEGDATFYLANLERVRGKTIDLGVDPPPDLAIEAVYSNPPTKALAAYRRLKVPEVWVGERHRVRILVLGADSRYRACPSSLAFPILTASEISEWIFRPDTGDDLEWTLALRQWIVETLAARVRITEDPEGNADDV